MTRIETFTCKNCGKQHADWPALTYTSPSFYEELTEEEKKKAELSSDFCVIVHPHQTDRFIRCTLTQKVIDHCEDLEYGLWISLSEKSFQDYSDNYNNDNYETKYFGWLSNVLPGYPDTRKVKATAFTRTGNQRPEIIPHEDFDHPFVKDYYEGITKKEAERRINEMIEFTAPNSTLPKVGRSWLKKLFGTE
jgi:hypothetical protein